MLFSVPSFAVGFASGFGTGFFTREVVRVSRVTLRPNLKSVIKTVILSFDKARESIAVASETFDDLVAEARTEIANLRSGAAPEDAAAIHEGHAAHEGGASRIADAKARNDGTGAESSAENPKDAKR